MTNTVCMIRHPTSRVRGEPAWADSMERRSSTLFIPTRLDSANNYVHEGYYWGKSSIVRLKCR